MEKESSIKQLINTSLEQVRTIIDADTVVGKQIVTPSGTVIIPISKVSMGFASGGLDLPDDGGSPRNFGGGGGTGVTVHPVGFLTIYPNGKVEMLPMAQEKNSPLEQVTELLDLAPDVIARIKNVISGVQNEEPDPAIAALEDEYAMQMNEPVEPELSAKELKKLRKAEAKAAKK